MKAGSLLNSRIYSAEYFDHKKNLGMYRAVPVCARNGYSGMIVELTSMPIKASNNNTKGKILKITQTTEICF